MPNIKLEHIDNLRRGKKSWSKTGSRWVPHHLYKYEEFKYERALKNKYLEINSKDRVNLRNLWQKVCLAKSWDNYTLVKDQESGTARILLQDRLMQDWDMKEMKQKIKQLIIH